MDQVEIEFLETQKQKPLVWFRYIHGNEKPSLFLEDFNKFYPNIKFSHEVNK